MYLNLKKRSPNYHAVKKYYHPKTLIFYRRDQSGAAAPRFAICGTRAASGTCAPASPVPRSTPGPARLECEAAEWTITKSKSKPVSESANLLRLTVCQMRCITWTDFIAYQFFTRPNLAKTEKRSRIMRGPTKYL
jgi:hypothetical protein